MLAGISPFNFLGTPCDYCHLNLMTLGVNLLFSYFICNSVRAFSYWIPSTALDSLETLREEVFL